MLRGRRWALALTTSALALSGATSAAAQNPVYPPGLEAEIGALVFRGDDPPLSPSLEVTGAQIESDRVVVRVGESARVFLTDRRATLDLRRIGETASFAVWLDPDADADTRAAADALVERIRGRDRGALAGEAAVPRATTRQARSAEPDAPTTPLRALAWLSLLALGGLLLARERALAWPQISKERVALFALFALALGLRLALPSWAPLHANDHGIEELRGLVTEDYGVEAMPYGGAYAWLVRAIVRPLGLGADAALALAALFGALAVVLLHRVVAQLAPGSVAPTLAALGLALHPTHVRLSLSEDPRPLAGALLLLGLLAGLLARRASRRSSRALGLVVAGLAWALAAELRVITVALPVAGVLFLVIAAPERTETEGPGWSWREGLAALGGGALVLFAVWSHRGVLEAALASGAERHSFSLWDRLLDPHCDVLLDPLLTSVALLPLAALGALGLLRVRRARTALAALVAFAVLTPPSLFICASRTDAIRYQSEAHLFLFVLLAGLAPFVWGARVSRPRALAIGAGLVLAIAAAPGLWSVSQPDVHEQASAIVRLDAPPAPTLIRVPPREMPNERKVRSGFPDYLIDAPERAARVTPDRLAEPTREACVVWVGPACWSFTDEEVREGLPRIDGAPFRAECAEMLGGADAARGALRSLAPVSVPHRDREFHRIPAETPRLGFAPCPSG
ncbi:MAG: hypothetical protein RLP09_28485 [Sandaracinaceae bacterium]